MAPSSATGEKKGVWTSYPSKAWREQPGLVLAGKVMVMVEACSHRPVWQQYTADALANDTRCAAEILAALPPRGLQVCDVGFCSVLWCDDLTHATKFVVTRMREKTTYRPRQVLCDRPYYRDEIIEVGHYRANPCQCPLRMVAGLWQEAWYRYVTKVPPACQNRSSRGPRPREHLRLPPHPSCAACPGGVLPRYAWLCTAAAGGHGALGPPSAQRAGRGGGAKKAFLFPIHGAGSGGHLR